MPTTRKIGYRCTCGAVIEFGGGGIESRDVFEALRDKRRQEGWAVMVVHAEALGGCGQGMMLQADDLLLIERQSE